MRRLPCLLAALTVGGMLAACAGESVSVTGGAVAAEVTNAQPERLLGGWVVTGIGDTAGEFRIRFEPGQLAVSGDCGQVSGPWRADQGGQFVALVTMGDRDCMDNGGISAPEWLQTASGFAHQGDGVVLRDAAGEVTAQLEPDGRQSTPVVAASPELRRSFPPAAPVPEELTPADPDELIGRWVPASRAGGAYLELSRGGQWRGSDGCNSLGGRFVAAEGGALLAVSGPQTLIGCDDGAPVGSWLAGASRAAFHGGELVLLDAAGAETGRLRAR